MDEELTLLIYTLQRYIDDLPEKLTNSGVTSNNLKGLLDRIKGWMSQHLSVNTHNETTKIDCDNQIKALQTEIDYIKKLYRQNVLSNEESSNKEEQQCREKYEQSLQQLNKIRGKLNTLKSIVKSKNQTINDQTEEVNRMGELNNSLQSELDILKSLVSETNFTNDDDGNNQSINEALIVDQTLSDFLYDLLKILNSEDKSKVDEQLKKRVETFLIYYQQTRNRINDIRDAIQKLQTETPNSNLNAIVLKRLIDLSDDVEKLSSVQPFIETIDQPTVFTVGNFTDTIIPVETNQNDFDLSTDQIEDNTDRNDEASGVFTNPPILDSNLDVLYNDDDYDLVIEEQNVDDVPFTPGRNIAILNQDTEYATHEPDYTQFETNPQQHNHQNKIKAPKYFKRKHLVEQDTPQSITKRQPQKQKVGKKNKTISKI